jgi:hypothetical protein
METVTMMRIAQVTWFVSKDLAMKLCLVALGLRLRVQISVPIVQLRTQRGSRVIIILQLPISPLVFAKVIATQMRIVSLDSFVSNAQEMKRFPAALEWLRLARTTVDLTEVRLLRHNRRVQSLLIQLLPHQQQLFKLCSLDLVLLPILCPSAKETVTMIRNAQVTWFASKDLAMKLCLVALGLRLRVQISALIVQLTIQRGSREIIILQLPISPLVFAREIATQMRIVSLDSFVNSAPETKRFLDASDLQNPVKTTADLTVVRLLLLQDLNQPTLRTPSVRRSSPVICHSPVMDSCFQEEWIAVFSLQPDSPYSMTPGDRAQFQCMGKQTEQLLSPILMEAGTTQATPKMAVAMEELVRCVSMRKVK